jgi:hypothetical protein
VGHTLALPHAKRFGQRRSFGNRFAKQYRKKDLSIDGATTLSSFNVRIKTIFRSESSRSSDRDELFSKSG